MSKESREQMNTQHKDNESYEVPGQEQTPIVVESEWAQLRECFYGWAEQYILPKFLQDADVRPSGEFREFWHANQEKNLADVAPEFYARSRSQIEGVVEFLVKQGVRVHRPTYISAANLKFPRGENHGCVTAFVRDGFVTIGNNVIELAPRSLFHRRQRYAIREILFDTMERGARYFAQPDGGADDNIEDKHGFGHLEGGDICVLGKTILVGHSGNASNPDGARWLQHVLGPEYDVQMVPIDKRFAHLDVVLSTPREGLAVMCKVAFPQGLPEYLRDWEIIDLDYETTKVHVGCNFLILNDHTVLLPSEAEHDYLAGELKKRNFEVIRLPYSDVYCFGGSLRCAYQPLIRV